MNDSCANLLQLVRQLDAFRRDGTLCDVTVLILAESVSAQPASCADDSQLSLEQSATDRQLVATFHCHRCVLAASSDYWRNMFAHDVQETRTRTVRFDAHVVAPRAFARILDFVYTGQLNLPLAHRLDTHSDSQLNEQLPQSAEQTTQHDAQGANGNQDLPLATQDTLELLHAAHLLAYDAVVSRCVAFLERSIDTGNCVLIERLANLLGLASLQAKAHRYIVQHFAAVYIDSNDDSTRLVELSLDQLISFAVDNDLFVASEADLLAFVLRYFAARKRTAALRATDLCAVLQHVRLDYVPIDTLRRVHSAFSVLFNDSGNELEVQSVAKLFTEAIACNSMQSCSVQEKRSNGTASSRRPPRASTVKRDAVVLVGGFSDTSISLSPNSMLHTDNAVRVFDAQRSVWRTLTTLPSSVRWCAVAAVSNSLYILGGVVHNDASRSLSDAVWRFDTVRSRWSACRAMPRVRAQHCACVIGAHVYVLGGVTHDGQLCTDIDCYDSANDCWLTVGLSSQTRRLSHLVAISLLNPSQCDDDDSLTCQNGDHEERAARNGPANCSHALIEIGGLRTPSQPNSIDTFEYYTVTGPYVSDSCDCNDSSRRSPKSKAVLAEQALRVDSSGEHFVLPETLPYPVAVAFDESTLFLLCEHTRKLVSFEPKRRCYKRLPDLPTARIGCALVVCNARLYVLGGYVQNVRRNAGTDSSALHAPVQRTASNGRETLYNRAVDAFRCRLAAFGPADDDAHVAQYADEQLAQDWLPSGLVECFDPATEQWHTVPEMQLPTACACHSAVTLRF